MGQTDYDRVVELVKTLDEDDQLRLRDLLDNWLGVPQVPQTEAEFDAEMLRRGVLDQVPKQMDDSRFRDYKPVAVEGKPVSETIIEERR